jgi:UDP-glucuronate decarboxylase
MNAPKEVTGPMNLGNPGEFTIKQLADMVLAKIGSTNPLEVHPLPIDDPTQRCPDISLAQKELGWQPLIALDEGLDKTISYFRCILDE